MAKLHAALSVEEFDDNYFYAAELKTFARQLGIAVGRRRKLELEALIRNSLEQGRFRWPNPSLIDGPASRATGWRRKPPSGPTSTTAGRRPFYETSCTRASRS